MFFFRILSLATVLLVSFSALALGPRGQEAPAQTNGKVAPKWARPLPATTCASAILGTYCHLSSPALADINGDDRLDIILATNNGHIVAIDGTGQTLWDRDTAPLFGMPANTQSIASSPAVADINADGRPEIVVGTGYQAEACHPGGMVVLTSNGQPLPGWPVRTRDNNIAPAGCADPVFGSPALGDLDNNGTLEIVVGSFDHRIYAWRHDGQLLPGFPGKSDLYVKLGWANMANTLGDTIWSSPALADLNNDGFLDIIIGSDEGVVEGAFGSQTWDCPYAEPPGAVEGYCGGSVYAYDRYGEFIPGYPKHLLEVIQSTPAIVDINPAAQPSVFVGTGSYYFNRSPDKPTYGQRLFGWSGNGAEIAGWEGGRATSAVLPASPVIGDIAGDSAPEVIMPGYNGQLYAWYLNGAPVSGFPMVPLNFIGDPAPQDTGKSPVLGDYDGDGKMEIFLTVGWTVVIIDGDGRILTNTNATVDQATPFYISKGLIQNNPALGDVDGDGALELVVQDSELTVWDLPPGAVKADWPMFKHDARRTSAVSQQHVALEPEVVSLAGSTGEAIRQMEELTISVPGSQFQWEAKLISPNGISLPQATGSGSSAASVPVKIDWSGSSKPGDYLLGFVEVRVFGDGLYLDSPKRVVPIRVNLVKTTSELFVPAIAASP